jgi:hypothetical protein
MKVTTKKAKPVVYHVRIVKRGDELAINVRGSEDPVAIVDVLRRGADLIEEEGHVEADSSQESLPLKAE